MNIYSRIFSLSRKAISTYVIENELHKAYQNVNFK